MHSFAQLAPFSLAYLASPGSRTAYRFRLPLRGLGSRRQRLDSSLLLVALLLARPLARVLFSERLAASSDDLHLCVPILFMHGGAGRLLARAHRGAAASGPNGFKVVRVTNSSAARSAPVLGAAGRRPGSMLAAAERWRRPVPLGTLGVVILGAARQAAAQPAPLPSRSAAQAHLSPPRDSVAKRLRSLTRVLPVHAWRRVTARNGAGGDSVAKSLPLGALPYNSVLPEY